MNVANMVYCLGDGLLINRLGNDLNITFDSWNDNPLNCLNGVS